MSDEEEERSRKRHRVSRACDTCRRRKERCDGDQPSCQRCIAASRTCYYNPTKKRGLRPGYVRTLEILLGLLLRAFTGAEDLLSSVLNQRIDESHLQKIQLQQRTDPLDVASLLEVWRKSTVLEELQNVLNSGDAVEDEDLYIQNLDTKLTSVFNSIARSKSSGSLLWDAEGREASLHTYYVEPEGASPAAPESHHRTLSRVEKSLATGAGFSNPPALKMPGNWSQLIDTYVTDTCSWLPVIQKYTLFRTASLSARADNDTSSVMPPKGEVTLLWAVFAYSAHRRLRAEAQTNHGQASDHEGLSARILAQARSLALQDQPRYDLGHVHASLTFGLLDMQRDAWSNAWLWVGRAVYIASTLGVVPPHGEQPFDDEMRRCFLGCFVLDTLVATKLGQRPYLRRSDLALVRGLSDDGPEEWESLRPPSGSASSAFSVASLGPGRVLSTFNDLCYITAAIGQYSDDLTHPRPGPSEFVSHLARRDNLASLMESQSLDSLLCGPPHILQAKLAAAAAYSRLQDTSREGLVGNGIPMQSSVQRGLVQIIDIVNTSSLSAFDSLWLPPTTHVLIQILKEGQPHARLHSQSIDGMSMLAGPSAQQGRLVEGGRTMSISTDLPPSRRRSSTMGSSSRAVGSVLDPASFPSNVDHTPLRKAAQSHQEAMSMIPHQVVNPGMTETGMSRFVPVLTPPLSTQPDELQSHGPMMERHDTQAVVGPASDGASDGLFHQLISLDNSEWYVVMLSRGSLCKHSL